MRIISTSYSKTTEFDNPKEWLRRISFYTGILEELAKQHEIISIERINYQGELRQNGVHYLFWKLKNNIVRFPVRLHRHIKKLQPDLVFVNGFIFPLQIIQLKLKLGRGVKIVVLHRAEKPFKGIKRYLQLLADKCVNAYLFTSSEFGHEWEKNINAKKIREVIQASSVFYPIDKTVAEKATNAKGNPVFLWVGMLIPRKDPLTVVKAFLEFVHLQPEARLYMIYQSDELLHKINLLLDSNAKYRNAIVLVGSIPHSQLLHWYNSADFFISASHYEGSGVAVSEAMSCGCIPVTSNFISFKKMTGPGKCGVIFETGNENDLLAALFQTKEMDIEKERTRVLKQFNEELSFEAIAKKINSIIGIL